MKVYCLRSTCITLQKITVMYRVWDCSSVSVAFLNYLYDVLISELIIIKWLMATNKNKQARNYYLYNKA